LFYKNKGSALGVSSNEQKEVFSLTSTTGKSPTVSKKRDSQNSISSRRQKTAKNSTTYNKKKRNRYNNICNFFRISVQTEWTWKDMETLEQYRGILLIFTKKEKKINLYILL